MSSQKAEFELRMVEKAKELQKLVKENLKCLQSINSLFKFTPGKSTKLTKHGHSIFRKLGSLKNLITNSSNNSSESGFRTDTLDQVDNNDNKEGNIKSILQRISKIEPANPTTTPTRRRSFVDLR